MSQHRQQEARERELRDKAGSWSEDLRVEDLTCERLREIGARHGVDFATTLLYDRVASSAKHGPFIRQIGALPRSGGMQRRFDDVTFAVAPGAFYRELPHIGADGRLLRAVAAELGCRTALVPVPSTGGLVSNARTIRDWLLRQPDRPIILASLSKGGADVRLAMAGPDGGEAFRNVAAWINICGMLSGTPLVPALLERRFRTGLVRLLFWWRGFDFQMVRDLDPRPHGLLAGELAIPDHLRLVNIVGFPLMHHMRNGRSRMWRRMLDPLGPNDGAVLLRDVCSLPGLLYPVVGADHYLQPDGFDLRALATAVLQHLGRELGLFAPDRDREPDRLEAEVS